MIVSLDLTTLPGWAVVRSQIADFRAQLALFEALAARQFNALAACHLALDDRQGAMDNREIALAARLAEIEQRGRRYESMREALERGAQRVQEDARRLALAQAELANISTALDQRRRELGLPEQFVVRSDGDANVRTGPLGAELSAARAQLVRLAATSGQLNAARLKIERLQRRLLRQSVRLARLKGDNDQQRSERLRALERDRDRLAGELELARGRAAELAQELASRNQQTAQERKNWLAELRHLRHLLEAQGDPGRTAIGSTGASATYPNDTESLDSILAQFEQLQKELEVRLDGVSNTPLN